MRILPYRTPDSTIDGSLITFVDVTSIVRAESISVCWSMNSTTASRTC